MCGFLAFIITNDVALILAGLIYEVRWLVHVVPDTGNAVIQVGAVQVAPPAACLGNGEIDKDTLTRPYLWNEQLSILASLEIALLLTLFKDVIGLILWRQLGWCRIRGGLLRSRGLKFDSWVDNRHQLDSLLAQVFHKLSRVGKSLLVPGEHAIAFHVVDVQMDHIEWQISLTILARNSFHHLVRIVTPTALLVSEGPERRQRHVAR